MRGARVWQYGNMHAVTRHPYALAAALASIAAGFLHGTLIAAAHAGIPPAFLFFLLSGFLQVAWGAQFLHRRTLGWFYAGAVLNAGLTFFWLLSRTLPAPLADAPEPIAPLGILVAMIQLIAVATSFWCLYRAHTVTYARLALVILCSLALAAIGYAAAKGGEEALRALWPEMEEGAHHDSADEGHGE